MSEIKCKCTENTRNREINAGNEGKKISTNVIKLLKNKYLKGQISEILNSGTPTPPTVKMLIIFIKC